MKSLKKVLALLLVCGVVFGLTGCGDKKSSSPANESASGKVDQSSKEAVIASFVRAAVLKDREAGLACLSERTKKEEGDIDRWFSEVMDDSLERIVETIPCVQENGKWYIGQASESASSSSSSASSSVKVDQSSKAALMASVMRAVLLNKPDAFLACCSPRLKEQIRAKSSAEDMSEKEFLESKFQEAQEELGERIPFVKENGKWYVDFTLTDEAMEARSKADRTAQMAVVARFFSAALLEDVDGFWNCLSKNTRDSFLSEVQQQGMSAADAKKELLSEMQRKILNGTDHCIRKNGKWYLDDFKAVMR